MEDDDDDGGTYSRMEIDELFPGVMGLDNPEDQDWPDSKIADHDLPDRSQGAGAKARAVPRFGFPELRDLARHADFGTTARAVRRFLEHNPSAKFWELRLVQRIMLETVRRADDRPAPRRAVDEFVAVLDILETRLHVSTPEP